MEIGKRLLKVKMIFPVFSCNSVRVLGFQPNKAQTFMKVAELAQTNVGVEIELLKPAVASIVAAPSFSDL